MTYLIVSAAISVVLLLAVILFGRSYVAYTAGVVAGEQAMRRKCFDMISKQSETELAYAHDGELNVGVAKARFGQELSLRVLDL